MIRKLILSAVIATGAVAGLALTPGSAEAQPPLERFHQRFEVVAKRGWGAWHMYGSYRERCDA
jgi:hypothetical protein